MNNEIRQQPITTLPDQKGYQITGAGEISPMQLPPEVLQAGVEISDPVADARTAPYVNPAGPETPVVDAKIVSLEKYRESKEDDKRLNSLFGRYGRIASFFKGIVVEPFGRGSHNAYEWRRLENAHDERERQKILEEQAKISDQKPNTSVPMQVVPETQPKETPQPVVSASVQPVQSTEMPNNVTQFQTQSIQNEDQGGLKNAA